MGSRTHSRSVTPLSVTAGLPESSAALPILRPIYVATDPVVTEKTVHNEDPSIDRGASVASVASSTSYAPRNHLSRC